MMMSILTELIIFGIYFCSIMTTTFGHAFQAVGPIQVQVRGPQKVPGQSGPDLDRTLDSLGPEGGQVMAKVCFLGKRHATRPC